MVYIIKNTKAISKIFSMGFILTIIGFLVFFALNYNKAFDITDESFSLLWAMQPENVTSSISLFGFITNYIWLLSGKNIEYFRIFSIIILYLGALVFAISLDSFMTKKHHQASNISLKIILISALSVTIFIFFHKWQLFLSYNLLNLLGCLFVVSGLFIAYGQEKNRNSIMVMGGIIVGLGGLIASLSKPTTGLLLCFIVLMWVVFYYQNSRKYYFIIAAAMSSLVPLLFLIFIKFGAISEFYKYLLAGINLVETVQAGHDLKSIIFKMYKSYKPLISTPTYYFFHMPVFILLFALLFFRSPKEYYKKNREKIVIFLTFFFLVAIVFTIKDAYLNNKKELLSFFIFSTISLFLTVIIFNRLDKANKEDLVNIDAYKIVVLSLFILPFAYSLGTRSLMLGHSFSVMIFFFAIWIYSFNIFLYRYNHKIYFFLVLSALMVMMTAKLIDSAYSKPNRLVEIGLQDTDVRFFGVNGVLKVDKITAKYINDLKDTAIKSGWKEQNLLIDLTGGSPGALVILNAKIVGSPWLVGGYAGSTDLVKATIKLSGENPFDSWVLTAPYGKRRVPVSVLSDDDYNFAERYQMVGKVSTGHRSEIQLLWKPKN